MIYLCYLIFLYQVGVDNVHTALSLVGYDDEVEAAMKFVFGSTFLATTLDIAKKVSLRKS